MTQLSTTIKNRISTHLNSYLTYLSEKLNSYLIACYATVKQLSPNQWFYLLITFHVIFWTLIPTLVRSALPIDAMESTIWAKHLQWGYDKNPFLNAWLTALAIKIGGQSDWIIYLFSQIAIALCLWAVWKLARKFLSPIHALIAVFILEGVQYFNFSGIDFNDNLIELPLWALTALTFYNALKEQNLRDWLLVGLFAGLAMMDKYYVVMLLIPMLGLVLIDSGARKSFAKPGIYAGLLIFTLIITPHILWLSQHDYITVNYAVNRVTPPPFLTSHIIQPLRFAVMQLLTFAGALLLFFTLFYGKNDSAIISKKHTLSQFDKKFLITIGLGPFITTILLSLITGITLHDMWGMPLLSLWGILLVAWSQPKVTMKQLARFIAVVFVWLIVLLLAFSMAFYNTGNTSKAQFPGKAIAASITKQWHERYHTKLAYVAGPRWLAGNVSFYSVDRPAVYMEWQNKFSPWINEDDLKRQGAVFVWTMDENKELALNAIKERFPNTQIMPPQAYPWMRNTKVTPLTIGIAFLPPAVPTDKSYR